MNFIKTIANEMSSIRSKSDCETLLNMIPGSRKLYFGEADFIKGTSEPDEVWQQRKAINLQLKVLKKKFA